MTGYTAEEKAAILEAEGIPAQRSCPICGTTGEPIEMHHVIRRSDGGENGPQVPLCKSCHGYAKGANYLLYPRASQSSGGDKWYAYILSDDFARYLAARVGATRAVERYYPLHVERDGVDEIRYDDGDMDDSDHSDKNRREIDEAVRLGATTAWLQGSALKDEWEHLEKKYGKKDARERYRDFLDSLEHPLSGATASKLRTFAALVSEQARMLPAEKGYYAAKAVAEGMPEGEAVSLAHDLSLADFRAEVWGTESDDKVSCPKCGSKVKKERLA